ncbi:MAG: sn-glycerol-3-phosphate ABC transporter ATP-binding protein UgpC [Rhodothermales bacterium]
MARVLLENVKKVYDNGFVAVHGASFEVNNGEFVVLVGPSGCGKSTTLRMVAGLEDITEGKLTIGERTVNDVPPKDRDIAMVFQNYALYPHMTVYDNMAFGLKLRKFDKKEIRSRVENAAETLGITEILDRKPKQLSGGQRQRVAVGRAIVRKPQVFLFDEPLSNLDAKLRVQMRTEISKLHNALGATMIYVTHDQVEAMTMGDRIVVLKDGHIQQIDTPLNLYNSPANRFVASFIGSPAMNFIDGEITRDGGLQFAGADGNVSCKVNESAATRLSNHLGKKVILGVRPEDIYTSGGGDGRRDQVGSFKLDVVEPMGNEIVFYAASGDNIVVARVSPQQLPDVGERISLWFDVEKLHFFDAESEVSL